MDEQNYDSWNKVKKRINARMQKDFFIKEKQVWYIHNGINVGFESNGKGNDFKRPVLVLKKLGTLFAAIPMTTKGKENNRFYYKLDKSYFNKESFLILSQIRVIDKKRFFEEIGEVSGEDFRKIKKELQNLLF